MTRKRFIKLVMSCGVQKRAAKKLALHYHTENFSYEDAFSIFCDESFKAAIKALEIFADVVREIGAAVRETEKTTTAFFDGREEDEKAD